MNRGALAQPKKAARARGFGFTRDRRTPSPIPFVVRRAEVDQRPCASCGSSIREGDLYALKEYGSPLCDRCLEPFGTPR